MDSGMRRDTANSIVRVQNLTKVHGRGETAVRALDGVSMSVESDEFVAAMSPSACSESTLLNLIRGLYRPSAGQVWFDDTDLASLDDTGLSALRRRKIGFVLQSFNLIPVLSAVKNVALPLVLDGVKMAAARGSTGHRHGAAL